MGERYHKTMKFKGYNAGDGEGIDEAIDKLLGGIKKQYGSVRLVGFTIYPIETQSLPPWRETYITVIAESAESKT